jgi:hypothetical protein
MRFRGPQRRRLCEGESIRGSFLYDLLQLFSMGRRYGHCIRAGLIHLR